MHPLLPLLLSLNAGFVDTVGFLELQGLFSAHVTGNFVTLAAALLLGNTGNAINKVVALPVFCAVIILTRLVGTVRLAWLMALQVLLLVGVAGFAVWLGPFPVGDSPPALLIGMLMVAAMALQNAFQKLHLPRAPATTAMTSNTTQLMLDIADWTHSRGRVSEAFRARIGSAAGAVTCFALGCAAAAPLTGFLNMWVFAIPPVLALGALLLATVPSRRPE